MRVSIIIPTVNRPRELERLLVSFEAQTTPAHEIIIVDQGEGAEATVSSHPRLPVHCIRVSPPSLTRARNAGVSASGGDVVGFLDDDCVVAPDYVEKIAAFFTARPEAKGVQGVITNFVAGHEKKAGGASAYAVYNFFAKLFFLNNSSRANKLLLSGRNQYAARPNSVVPCQWLSGVGNYTREVFREFRFDESLPGYALGEDKLFSYAIFERYPGTLFADPIIRLEHHHASKGRPEGREWVEMKILNTAYVWRTLLRKKGASAILAFWWANLGDTLSACVAALIRKRPLAFPWWHLRGYIRLLWNKKITT